MSLFSRVINVAIKPKEEWPVIAGETATTGSLTTGYILLLCAIAPICSLIQTAVIGSGIAAAFGAAIPVWVLIVGAIVTYVLTLLGVYIFAFVVAKLGPTFGSSDNYVSALKLVTFASAPYWLSGVLNIIPVVGILTFLVGLYGIYLMYVGMPHVMNTPQEKVVGYLIVSVIIYIIISAIFWAISWAIVSVGLIGGAMMMSA